MSSITSVYSSISNIFDISSKLDKYIFDTECCQGYELLYDVCNDRCNHCVEDKCYVARAFLLIYKDLCKRCLRDECCAFWAKKYLSFYVDSWNRVRTQYSC